MKPKVNEPITCGGQITIGGPPFWCGKCRNMGCGAVWVCPPPWPLKAAHPHWDYG